VTQSRASADGTVRRSSRDSGAALRKLVWDSLAPHLNDANRIFIVPDGTLSLIPFVALPVGRSAYLLEQAPPIHYVSSERDLVLPPSTSAQTTQGLLALGGPAFDATSGRPVSKASSSAAVSKGTTSTRGAGVACESFQSIRFQPLSGTLQEVREVANLWQRGPSSTDDTVPRVLVGAAASERTFKQEAPGHRVLHLATHGFFLGETCSSVPAGTRAVGGLATSSARPSATKVENPLLLSGLALAGANRRQSARPDEDDGILTAEEVAALNLANVEWAVLSACDTGIGQVKAGEGVFGLRRAFQVAGARSVIMSLWSVDDQATRAWMRALYDARFQKGLTTADAVHAASVEVFRDRKAKGQSTAPFFWAAFVAVGDWR
jgi:CHAT domain-containing protein